jgi:hypothetical protein
VILRAILPIRYFDVPNSFYNGGKMERHILQRAYLRLIRHVNSIYKVSDVPVKTYNSLIWAPRFVLHTNGPKACHFIL